MLTNIKKNICIRSNPVSLITILMVKGKQCSLAGPVLVSMGFSIVTAEEGPTAL